VFATRVGQVSRAVPGPAFVFDVSMKALQFWQDLI